ncbi:hypothetical protein F511_45358 [Dorcoceras hygrometricum]|uniref:Uncharacterized protein n=1 Tax=Dorcoceras hygrometricum TaxID=472368 RepID=A0A2Z7A3Q7_9LAMI|nr:hypothetical protein F511_45358 [Dorcoceras hygrometricum]
MARSSGEERRKCAQRFARGGDQRSPKAVHGGALPALASRDYLARIVSTSRAAFRPPGVQSMRDESHRPREASGQRRGRDTRPARTSRSSSVAHSSGHLTPVACQARDVRMFIARPARDAKACARRGGRRRARRRPGDSLPDFHPGNHGSDTTVGDPDPPSGRQRKNNQKLNREAINTKNKSTSYDIHRMFSVLPRWHLCLAPTDVSRTRLFSVDCGRFANPVHDQI